MRQKLVFPALLIALGLVVSGYFSCRLAPSLWDYFSRTAPAEAKIGRWEVLEMEGRFALKAVYSFEAQEKIWSGEALLPKPWYLNEPAALATLKDKARQRWAVWFNPKAPGQSSLGREFPLGLLCRSLICYAVFGYFVFFFKKIINNFDN